MSKKWGAVFFFVILLVIPNPGNSAESREPGRSVKMTEVKRITDYDGDFIFRSIRGIKISDDGSVYVRCREHLFKFTPDGKWVLNYITKGEGPGEVKYFVNFDLSENSIWVGAVYPVKLIRFSTAGEMEEETAVRGIGNFSVFAGIWGRPYFIKQDQDIRNSKSGILKETNTLFYLDQNNLPVNTGLTFTTKNLMMKESGKNGMRVMISELTHLLRAYDGKRFLYISESEKYRIFKVDLKSHKMIKKFTQDYKPIPYVKKEYTNKVDVELNSLYDRKFYNDIYKILIYQGKLLIFTSTLNGEGEMRVDILDSKGTFSDHFYLKLPGVERPDDLERKPLLLHKGYLWTTDIDEDDVPFVLKYRIEGF